MDLVEKRSGVDRRQTPWIDTTVRPPGDPEVELTPNDEVEVSFSWDEIPGITGRHTILVSREAAERLLEGLTRVLGAIPAGLI